tara:strand:+ start:6281 stop:6628 length:348 start_codon:yes stop_codon:yes gene_type:complete
MYGTYRNKHNNREITIERMEISDCGTNFWYADAYDMFTERDLERNWDMVSELGTPKPAMTHMESVKLAVTKLRDDYTSLLDDPTHRRMRSKDRDVESGWIEALTHVITLIEGGDE